MTELYGAVFNECAFSQFQILISIPESYLVSSRVIVSMRCVMPGLMLDFELEVTIKLNIETSYYNIIITFGSVSGGKEKT